MGSNFLVRNQRTDQRSFSLSVSSLLDRIVTGYKLLSSRRGNSLARSARLFSPFFDSLVFGYGAVGLSKLFTRAIYNAALASLS